MANRTYLNHFTASNAARDVAGAIRENKGDLPTIVFAVSYGTLWAQKVCAGGHKRGILPAACR